MHQASSARRVLVVDDNPDAAELVGEVMSMQGHVVALAHGGKEALAAAEKFLPDVVFLDIGMPSMDGYEVASEMRRNPLLDAARIVALTAWGDLAARPPCRRLRLRCSFGEARDVGELDQRSRFGSATDIGRHASRGQLKLSQPA